MINGVTVTNTLSFTMKTAVKSGLTISPTTASPVLKTQITISLDTDFPFTLNRDDFTVNATSQTNSTYVRYMNVIAVDDTAKTLTALFGGAYSGLFDISIRHSTFGLLKTDGVTLTVGSWVTNVTPKVSSIYGGALLTITGTNFGNEKTDNPVQISYNGGVGSTNCYVQTSTPTQITCRVDDTVQFDNTKTGEVVVFLKTSEEATCEGTTCEFSYTDTLPTISSVTPTYDTTNNKWTLVVSGTGFTGDASSTTLIVGGITQTTSDFSSTSVTFTLDNLSSESFSDAKIYFDSGVPTSNVDLSTTVITPKLVSVSPNEGSIGGSTITASIQGVGVNTKSVDLVDSTGTSIC